MKLAAGRFISRKKQGIIHVIMLHDIKILLADDHKMLREGLRALIENQPDMKVAAEADNGREAVRRAVELAPDVVIMDISMPGLNGIEATRQIIARLPSVRIIVLSMHSDKRFVVEMLRAGAKGYLLKECAAEELINAIRSVSKNVVYLSPGIAGDIVRDYVNLVSADEIKICPVLTAREREVLQFIAEGRNTKEIAHELNISVKTIETHRKQVMDKLDIHNIADLTKYAIREGLTTL